jgi:photosystem II stability/assembly factor-like uncharacterized protein
MSNLDPALLHGLEWRNVGPSRGGRVTAVAGMAAEPATFYFGGTGGGVWKTTNYGESWSNVSDGFFAVGSIGSIAVAESNADIVYVGTGSDAIRSNVSIGRGMYRSSDAGKTWTMVGLEKAGQLGAIEIHPQNPDIVFVAALGNPFGRGAERGVYRTRDGGRTWQKVLFVSDSTGAVDLAMNARNPDEVYASLWRAERKPWTIISGAREGGIYKTNDGGETWTHLTNGLPGGLRGKSSVTVSRSNPNVVYVLIEAPGDEGGVYRSDDAGATWRQTSRATGGILNRPFYYTYIDVDPRDPEKVWINNEGYFLSTDGGKTWQRRSTPHGDNHGMWINPENPDIIVQSNDGGANVTVDGGRTWSTQHNQPTAELYQVDVDDRFPYWLYAGQQDNTTIAVPSIAPQSHPGGHTGYWREIGGCETGPAVPKPTSQGNIVYSNCKGRFGRYSSLTGQEKQYYVGAANIYGHNPKDLKYRFQRVSPIYVSPHDPNVVYHASQFLHRTTDEGVTWETISPDLTANDPRGQVISGAPVTRDITGEEFYSTLYTLAESKLERGVIWTGSNDGVVQVTRDNGATWTNVTPKELASGGRYQTVEASPHRRGSAYAAVLRYMFDDWKPYLYRTDDYGRSWTLLTGANSGFPQDQPTRVIREDPVRAGLLYAGTEFGMFISYDNGTGWQPLQLNLPAVPVTDLKVVGEDLVIATQGRSFWVLDDVSALRQMTSTTMAAAAHLFTPRSAVRMRMPRSDGGPAAPEYPATSVNIDYWLGQEAQAAKLEILNAAGEVLSTVESRTGAQPAERPEQGMRGPPGAQQAAPQLETALGLHRFGWDLRHAMQGGRGGAIVPPGRYTARLTVGTWTAAQPFDVRMDPRIEADGVTQADLVEQYEFNKTVAALQSEARELLQQVQAARQPAQGQRAQQIDELLASLTQRREAYPQPMLVEQISYLANMTASADQKIGKDATARLAELRSWLDRDKQKFASLAR